jgi:hypothetical protein
MKFWRVTRFTGRSLFSIYSFYSVLVCLAFAGCGGSRSANVAEEVVAEERRPRSVLDILDINKKESPKSNLSDLSTKLTRQLGFANLGNTCFANAAHKLITRFINLDAFLKSEVPFISRDLQEDVQGMMKLYHEKKDAAIQLDSSLATPLVAYQYDAESRSIFNHLSQFSSASGSPLDFILGGKIGVHPLDSGDYLSELLNALGYIQFYGGVDTMTSEGVTSSTQLSQAMLKIPFYESKVTSAHELIQSFLKENKIELLETQGTYQKQSDASRRQILLQMQRRLPSGSVKNLTPIEIEDVQLNFYQKPTEPTDLLKGKLVSLRPTAIICHRGNTYDDGHYIAYTYEESLDSWLLHDDLRVTVVSEHDVRTMQLDWNMNASIVLYTEDVN